MLALLSDVNQIAKLEVTKPEAAVYSGAIHQGTFVASDGTAAEGGAHAAYAIWNESTAANTWSPDVTATGNVTCLLGGYRCKTDQYTGTPAVGDQLCINTSGVLKAATADGTESVVGYCLAAPEASFAFKGSTYTVLHVHIV
jgi:hypothetical protein